MKGGPVDDEQPAAGVRPADGAPGRENTPRGDEVSGRSEPGPPPPGTNQGKNEPVANPPRPTKDAESTSSDEPQRTAPEALAADGTHPGAMPTEQGVPAPGDAVGTSLPGVHAAASGWRPEQPSDAVRITAIASPGKPDGEVDTRPAAGRPGPRR
jgi:hypothetical protein